MKRQRTCGIITIFMLAVATHTAGRSFASNPLTPTSGLCAIQTPADTVTSPSKTRESASGQQTQASRSLTPPSETRTKASDTRTLPTDSLLSGQSAQADSIIRLSADSVKQIKAESEKKSAQWLPDPKRALWLSLVLPGAGQIYNRKYWKLPIIYGGFIGCTYALLWNGQMYHDYSQAYIDIMDDDPNTASYLKMLPLGYDITGREEQFKTIFKHKKDFYRRYRDLSIFAFVGVYLLSVIDAYVDAQLSSFDISKDLSLKVEPAVIQQQNGMQRTHAVGLQCSLKF